MKKIYLLVMLLATVFVACSDDDDKDEDKTTGKEKLVSKIIDTSESGNVSETLFEYDSKGRITKIVNNDPEDTSPTTTYTYETGKIIAKEVENGQTITYTLNDKGLVTSSTNEKGEKSNYTYDANDQLLNVKEGTWETSITWQNGNVIKQSLKSDGQEYDTFEYTYSTNEYKGNLGWFVDGINEIDAFLMDYGYMGKRNKNLVQQTTETLYEYTFDNEGYVTIIKEYNIYDGKKELEYTTTVTYKE